MEIETIVFLVKVLCVGTMLSGVAVAVALARRARAKKRAEMTRLEWERSRLEALPKVLEKGQTWEQALGRTQRQPAKMPSFSEAIEGQRTEYDNLDPHNVLYDALADAGPYSIETREEAASRQEREQKQFGGGGGRQNVSIGFDTENED